MKSYWTDPAGIVVAKVRDDVAYHYGRGCIHSPAREFARTGVFKVTNWKKKEHDHNHDRHCKQIWSSSYALFRNPGLPTGFPACKTPGPLEIPSYNDVHLHVKRNNIHVTPDNNGYWHPWKMKRTGNPCRVLLSPHKVGYIPQAGRVHP